ncbi:SURF1 family protein [Aquisalimonas asiatica]|uniref:SURF1-like protein n=1 Tax=Aquisalimonas asiatica TaxID=406100 RepID=A0A1H8TLH1_9GAMM|nr:SURF1 family protein [Aquisalimonas asiatica]SEO91328.1 Cytochrome oxidase assembly protein ShyY1 [Aquisalimonas asiatica]
MRLGRYQFRPRIVPTLATLLVFPALLALGFWQLDRADQRQAIVDAYETRDQRPEVDLNAESMPAGDAAPRNTRAYGRFDDERQLLLDNQFHRGQVGYHVLTPFHIEGSDAVVLVDRGWVPAGDSRAELPDVQVDGARRSVTGFLDQGPPSGLRLGGMADGETGWPLRIQYLDFEELEGRLGVDLMPRVLRLDPEAPDGFARDWGPAFREGYGPERNHGYAVQWFGLATALAVIFLVVNTKRMGSDDKE